MTETAFKYRAFISYSHKDASVACWLAQAMEGYRLPKELIGKTGRDEPVPRFIRPVFRDRDELPASADLGATLREALEASRVLVVLCSPDSAKSKWVEEEILSFKRGGRSDRILAVIVRGKPHSDDAVQECFPDALRFSLLGDGCYDRSRIAEPIAADLTAEPRHDVLLRVLAGVLGIAFDGLKQRHRAREKKQRLLLGLLISVLLASFTGLWWWKESEASHAAARASARLATEKRTNEAASEREQGREALIGGDPTKAIGPLLASVEKVPDDDETLRLLGRAAHETSGLQRVLRGHTAEVRSIVRSDDEAWMVSIGSDGRVLVWDTATGQERHRVEGAASPVADFVSAQFSPAGRFLLIRRSFRRPAILLTLADGARQETPAAEVILCTAGGRVLLIRETTGDPRGSRVSWWNPQTMEETEGPLLPVASWFLACVDRGARSAVIKGRIANEEQWVWLRTDTGELIASGRGPRNSVPGEPVLSPDGKKIAVRGDQGWELHETGGRVVKLAAMLPSKEGSLIQFPVISATFDFADEGRFLVSANQGATLTIWDTEGKALRHLSTRGIVTVTGDPSQPRALLRSDDGRISVIQLPDGRAIGEFNDRIARVTTDGLSGMPAASVVFSKQALVAVAAKSSAVKLWSFKDLRRDSIPLTSASALGVTSLAWSTDGRKLLVTQADGSVSVCDPMKREELAHWQITSKQGGSADGGALLPDGSVLIVDESGIATRWSGDGKPDRAWQKDGPATPADAADFNRAMKRVEAMARDPWLHGGLPPRFWGTSCAFAGRGDPVVSVLDGGSLRRLSLPDEDMLRDFTANATVLLAGDDHGTVSVWDSAQSKNARHIPCAQQPLRRIVLSPDGTALAVLTDDGEVSLWSMKDNACLQRWRIQNTTAHDLCFIGGAHRLGVACADGQIRVIEVGKPAAVPGLLDSQRPPPDRTFIFAPPAGMSRDIRGATVLAANSDSSIFSAGFDHGSAIMWSSRSLLPVMRATCDGVTALSFSPAGDLLAIGTNTGGVLVLSTAPASKAEIGRLAQLLGNIMPTDGR